MGETKGKEPAELTAEQKKLWKQHIGHLKKIAADEAKVHQYEDAARYAMGDQLLLIEAEFGKRSLRKAADEVVIDYQIVRQRANISRKFPENHRARSIAGLTWSHLRAIAGEPDPEKRERWLDLALEEKLAVADLQKRVNAEKQGAGAATRSKQHSCAECDLPILVGAGTVQFKVGEGAWLWACNARCARLYFLTDAPPPVGSRYQSPELIVGQPESLMELVGAAE